MVDPLPTFSANLRAAREGRGLTQSALAERAGMDPAELRRLESGRRDPGVRVMTRLARALDLPPSQLLAGIE